jgi:hypothetical protein
MIAKLDQVIAIEKGVKAKAHQELTEAHQQLQKPSLLAGISRTCRRKDEEDEQLPPESTKVQLKPDDTIRSTVDTLTELFDVTATKDWANCEARADVVVDGNVLAAQVSVTYLLFLEKQLVPTRLFARWPFAQRTSTIFAISGGALRRTGGPVNPSPLLTKSVLSPSRYVPLT